MIAGCAGAAPAQAPATPRPAPTLARWDAGALHVTGAPPLDRAIVRALAPYESIEPVRLVDVAAAGDRVLIVRGGALDELRAPGGEPIARGGDGELDVGWGMLTGDGAVYAGDRDGDEDARLYRDDGVPLLAAPHARVADPVATGGDTFAWAEPAGDGATTALWLWDGGARRVFVGDGAWAPLARSRDGRFLLARRFASVRSSALYRVDVATGAAVALTPADTRASAPGGAFGDGAVYAIADFGADRLGAWELRGRAWSPLAPELAWDVAELAVSADGATVAFTTDEDGVSVLHLWQRATRSHQIAVAAPTGGVITELRFARAAPVLAFSFTSPTAPRAAYTYELGSARLVAWTPHALPAGIAARMPARVRVTSFDGVSLSVLAYLPARATPAPVVVELHGGPEDQWQPRWAGFTQFLVARGVAVIQPDVRGSTGYGAEFAALDDGARRDDATRDVGAVLDWIATRRELDARRVVVMGRSYGGYLALAALATYPDRLRGGVDLAGIADFVTFLEGTRADRRDRRRAEYGDERDPATRAELARRSPLARVAAIRAPVVIGHGARDPRVPAADADRLVAALRAAGRPVWYVVADDEGHGFAKLASRAVFGALVVQFLAGALR